MKRSQEIETYKEKNTSENLGMELGLLLDSVWKETCAALLAWANKGEQLKVHWGHRGNGSGGLTGVQHGHFTVFYIPRPPGQVQALLT